jgi:hypothetical protein
MEPVKKCADQNNPGADAPNNERCFGKMEFLLFVLSALFSARIFGGFTIRAIPRFCGAASSCFPIREVVSISCVVCHLRAFYYLNGLPVDFGSVWSEMTKTPAGFLLGNQKSQRLEPL